MEVIQVAQRAAAIGRVGPEALAVGGGLLVDARGRADGPDGHAVARLQPVPQGVGFREEQPGVEGEDVDGQAVPRDQVDEDAALGPEPGGEREAGREASGRPQEHVGGRPPLEL